LQSIKFSQALAPPYQLKVAAERLIDESSARILCKASLFFAMVSNE
jgi:hypothetical protein